MKYTGANIEPNLAFNGEWTKVLSYNENAEKIVHFMVKMTKEVWETEKSKLWVTSTGSTFSEKGEVWVLREKLLNYLNRGEVLGKKVGIV